MNYFAYMDAGALTQYWHLFRCAHRSSTGARVAFVGESFDNFISRTYRPTPEELGAADGPRIFRALAFGPKFKTDTSISLIHFERGYSNEKLYHEAS